MSNLIYASPDNIKPNRDRIGMRIIDKIDFLDLYKPICNENHPFPNSYLNDELGNIVWDKREYSLLGNYISEKRIWTVSKINKHTYEIVTGIKLSGKKELIGYIITDIAYHRNEIGNLKVIIEIEHV